MPEATRELELVKDIPLSKIMCFIMFHAFILFRFTFMIVMFPILLVISFSSPSLFSPVPLFSLPPTSLSHHLKLMEHVTGVLKIAVLQSVHFFLSIFFSFPLPNIPIFLFFFPSPRRGMNNGEKACQLIYQLGAHVQPSMLSGLTDWGSETEGPGPGLWLSVMTLTLWPLGFGGQGKTNNKLVNVDGCRLHVHHLFLMRRLNYQGKAARRRG